VCAHFNEVYESQLEAASLRFRVHLFPVFGESPSAELLSLIRRSIHPTQVTAGTRHLQRVARHVFYQ